MESEDWEENCIKQLGVKGTDSYAQECCESLDNIHISLLSMISYLYRDIQFSLGISFAESNLAYKITKGDEYSMTPAKANMLFRDFKKKVLALLEVIRGDIEESKDNIDFVSENIERAYHSCIASPHRKVRFYNKLKKQTSKAKRSLHDAHVGIKKAITALRDAKRLTDVENMTIYNEQMRYALDAILKTYEDLCDAYKALAIFAKKYSVFQSALHC
ncbi:MAG: hypothetical protein JHC26_02175 [Thermofilum sp.]|jgi:hypothetical protein|uniref:hypothetical protein n=1 Tax=Thermofilum sp. TaxID=1961369 RepID=UPI002582AFEA|nr:hypothetical protein [Thermofilum sp.]MCI4407871.1 hypothetical protein [Thermofilum sp.]